MPFALRKKRGKKRHQKSTGNEKSTERGIRVAYNVSYVADSLRVLLARAFWLTVVKQVHLST